MSEDPPVDRIGGGETAAAKGAVGLALHGLEGVTGKARDGGELGGGLETHCKAGGKSRSIFGGAAREIGHFLRF